jgi:small GTP-binding protein
MLHVWDTLGEEKFKSVAPLFFRKAVGAILVYDVTSKKSFDAVESWYENVKNYCDSNVVVMLLGNKMDLPNKEVPNNMA